jgi:hypothetical protein
MPLPVVVSCIRVVSQGSIYPSLGSNRVGAKRMDFRYYGNLKVRIAG